MAYTPYTIQNLSTDTSADIRSVTFVDQSGIAHHSDFSNFGGIFTGNTNHTPNTTVQTRSKTYVTGSPLRKTFVSDTRPITKTIASSPPGAYITSSLLTVTNVTGLVTGWQGNGVWAGVYIIGISGGTNTLTMSSVPSGAPTPGGSVIFSTSTKEITLSNTTGLGAGWTISGNGYTVPGTVTSVKDGSTIVVSALADTTPSTSAGNPNIFTSSTNFLTLNNTTGLDIGWEATGNGYDGTQQIQSINGDTVIMSAPPGSGPVVGNAIEFTNSTIPIYILAPLSSIVFSLDYTNSTSVLGNYSSAVTINGNLVGPVILKINNYVGIGAKPVPIVYAPTGGGAGGQGWTNYGAGSGGNGGLGSGGYTSGANIGAATPHGADGGNNGGGGATGANGGPAGPGAGECFLPDAKITMVDGSVKNFRDLRVGDMVVGAFGECNPVLALYYSKMGNIPMYKINDDHDCTNDEVFVTTDKKFYCIDPSPGTDGVLAGWKESYEMDLGNGTTDIWTSPWSIGQVDIELHKATTGIEIQTTNGGRKLETFEPYYLPPETDLYNCVVGGSHTIMINGYAHTAWVREDDFDYTAWQPIDIKLTVEDYRNPKKSKIGN